MPRAVDGWRGVEQLTRGAEPDLWGRTQYLADERWRG